MLVTEIYACNETVMLHWTNTHPQHTRIQRAWPKWDGWIISVSVSRLGNCVTVVQDVPTGGTAWRVHGIALRYFLQPHAQPQFSQNKTLKNLSQPQLNAFLLSCGLHLAAFCQGKEDGKEKQILTLHEDVRQTPPYADEQGQHYQGRSRWPSTRCCGWGEGCFASVILPQNPRPQFNHEKIPDKLKWKDILQNTNTCS